MYEWNLNVFIQHSELKFISNSSQLCCPSTKHTLSVYTRRAPCSLTYLHCYPSVAPPLAAYIHQWHTAQSVMCEMGCGWSLPWEKRECFSRRDERGSLKRRGGGWEKKFAEGTWGGKKGNWKTAKIEQNNCVWEGFFSWGGRSGRRWDESRRVLCRRKR